MLVEKIQSDLKDAQKAKDEKKVSVLRFLLSAIYNRAIALRVKPTLLPDEETISVIQHQVKQGNESLEAFKKGERNDLFSKQQHELDILNTYLPQQLSAEELSKIIKESIKEIGASGMADFGKVMGMVMGKVKGRTDGKIVAEIVKKSLGSNNFKL